MGKRKPKVQPKLVEDAPQPHSSHTWHVKDRGRTFCKGCGWRNDRPEAYEPCTKPIAQPKPMSAERLDELRKWHADARRGVHGLAATDAASCYGFADELFAEIDRLRAEVAALRSTVIGDLVRAYVANLGRPDAEFISCITPVHRSDAKSKMCKYWKMWDAAITEMRKATP